MTRSSADSKSWLKPRHMGSSTLPEVLGEVMPKGKGLMLEQLSALAQVPVTLLKLSLRFAPDEDALSLSA